jgi:hypothetical protein
MSFTDDDSSGYVVNKLSVSCMIAAGSLSESSRDLPC